MIHYYSTVNNFDAFYTRGGAIDTFINVNGSTAFTALKLHGSQFNYKMTPDTVRGHVLLHTCNF